VTSSDAPAPVRRRDATRTRQSLLDAARRRFASEGYAATTVRDIADDAGVNVSLISRYFTSKEGLFEECLMAAVEELRTTTGDVPLAEIPAVIAAHAAGFSAEGVPNQLVLLLRESGDQRADEIRVKMLRSSAERLAAAAGWQPGDPDSDGLLLRAEVVLAATIGIAMLRSSLRLQPLATAGEEALTEPLRALVEALLPARPAPPMPTS
jgi:AcrR family transcriptional regulator